MTSTTLPVYTELPHPTTFPALVRHPTLNSDGSVKVVVLINVDQTNAVIIEEDDGDNLGNTVTPASVASWPAHDKAVTLTS